MAYAQHEKDRARLVQEIQGTDYAVNLRRLQQRHPALTRFRAWADVIAFMQGGESNDPRKDEVLRAIFGQHSTDQDPRWRTVLLLMFWPALHSILRQKERWDHDPEELWQNINWTFLKVVCRIDLAKRPYGLVQKIFNDTVHRLWDEYRYQFKSKALEIGVDAEELETLIGAGDDIDYDGISFRLDQEAAIKKLHGYLEAGHISEEDYLLLIGTRVYGKSAAEYARENGLAYESTRKRRLRVEAAIRRHERRYFLSRSFVSKGPFSSGGNRTPKENEPK